jgi:hypothetical protein
MGYALYFPNKLYSNLNVFIKSIISHPFLKHCHRNNSIYKILNTPPPPPQTNRGTGWGSSPGGGGEEICRRMPRTFFSSSQFQRKRKSLVFFQSINFLCRLQLMPNHLCSCGNWQELQSDPALKTKADKDRRLRQDIT